VALEVDTSITGTRVKAVLQRWRTPVACRDRLRWITARSFEGQVARRLAYSSNVQLSFIRPGKPNENAYIESSTGSSATSASTSMVHHDGTGARSIENWADRIQHRASSQLLGDMTPEEFAARGLTREKERVHLSTADSNPSGTKMGVRSGP